MRKRTRSLPFRMIAPIESSVDGDFLNHYHFGLGVTRQILLQVQEELSHAEGSLKEPLSTCRRGTISSTTTDEQNIEWARTHVGKLEEALTSFGEPPGNWYRSDGKDLQGRIEFSNCVIDVMGLCMNYTSIFEQVLTGDKVHTKMSSQALSYDWQLCATVGRPTDNVRKVIHRISRLPIAWENVLVGEAGKEVLAQAIYAQKNWQYLKPEDAPFQFTDPALTVRRINDN